MAVCAASRVEKRPLDSAATKIFRAERSRPVIGLDRRLSCGADMRGQECPRYTNVDRYSNDRYPIFCAMVMV